MLLFLKNYFSVLQSVLFSPNAFFSARDPNWNEKPFTFAVFSAWIFALGLAIFIFFQQYVPLGQYLVEGIAGIKFLLILPVLILVGLVFFGITFIILGAFLMLAWLFGYGFLGFLILNIARLLGGKGDIKEITSAFFYSSGILNFLLLSLIWAGFLQKGLLSANFFVLGFNLIFFATVLYSLYIWSIILRRFCLLSGFKLGMVFLFLVLIILAKSFVLNKAILPKIIGLLA